MSHRPATAPEGNRKARRLEQKRSRKAQARAPVAVPSNQAKNSNGALDHARELVQQQNFEEAIRHLQTVKTEHSALAEFWLLLGLSLEQLNSLTAASQSYKKAVELAPDNAEGWHGLGRVLHNGNRFDASEVALERCLSIQPDNAETLKLLALARYGQGDCKGGLRACKKAMVLKPEWDQAYYIKGLLHKSTGHNEDARKALTYAHMLNPGMINALLELVDITEAAQLDDLLEKLDAFQEDGLGDPLKKSALQFSIAKVYHRKKQHDEAFSHYRAANDLGKGAFEFEREAHSKTIDETITAFSPELFRNSHANGSTSSRPIFIVGMPRSGTSLTEQIISSHKEVFGVGESYALNAIAEALSNAQGGDLSYPADVGRIDTATLASLAEEYLSRIDRLCPAETQRFTDKMVFNFLNLGLIALLFPNASIIHCRRDPMDTCLSCYFQRFDSAKQLSFTSDLEDLGFYYREYDRLMAHWQDVLPMPILDVEYEKLITNQDSESRRIIEYLKLDWDDACLSFHEQERAVLTASMVQARKPIYQTATGRWRRYEKHLGSLKDALGDLA